MDSGRNFIEFAASFVSVAIMAVRFVAKSCTKTNVLKDVMNNTKLFKGASY